eukprot:UN06076
MLNTFTLKDADTPAACEFLVDIYNFVEVGYRGKATLDVKRFELGGKMKLASSESLQIRVNIFVTPQKRTKIIII